MHLNISPLHFCHLFLLIFLGLRTSITSFLVFFIFFVCPFVGHFFFQVFFSFISWKININIIGRWNALKSNILKPYNIWEIKDWLFLKTRAIISCIHYELCDHSPCNSPRDSSSTINLFMIIKKNHKLLLKLCHNKYTRELGIVEKMDLYIVVSKHNVILWYREATILFTAPHKL